MRIVFVNIFALSSDPREAARSQCDQHAVKMPLEAAQILSTVQRLEGNDDPRLYKRTHSHHPCVKWTRATRKNYEWLYEHYLALLHEYSYRYHRKHKSGELRTVLKKPPASLKGSRRTAFAQAMPEEFRGRNGVAAYRRYYRAEKKFCRWRRARRAPAWLSGRGTRGPSRY